MKYVYETHKQRNTHTKHPTNHPAITLVRNKQEKTTSKPSGIYTRTQQKTERPAAHLGIALVRHKTICPLCFNHMLGCVRHVLVMCVGHVWLMR